MTKANQMQRKYEFLNFNIRSICHLFTQPFGIPIISLFNNCSHGPDCVSYSSLQIMCRHHLLLCSSTGELAARGQETKLAKLLQLLFKSSVIILQRTTSEHLYKTIPTKRTILLHTILQLKYHNSYMFRPSSCHLQGVHKLYVYNTGFI